MWSQGRRQNLWGLGEGSHIVIRTHIRSTRERRKHLQNHRIMTFLPRTSSNANKYSKLLSHVKIWFTEGNLNPSPSPPPCATMLSRFFVLRTVCSDCRLYVDYLECKLRVVSRWLSYYSMFFLMPRSRHFKYVAIYICTFSVCLTWKSPAYPEWISVVKWNVRLCDSQTDFTNRPAEKRSTTPLSIANIVVWTIFVTSQLTWQHSLSGVNDDKVSICLSVGHPGFVTPGQMKSNGFIHAYITDELTVLLCLCGLSSV